MNTMVDNQTNKQQLELEAAGLQQADQHHQDEVALEVRQQDMDALADERHAALQMEEAKQAGNQVPGA
jgi:aspartyl/asparaginyl-tRNA synthetase